MTAERPEFLSAHWDHPLNTQGWMLFRVNKISGQWRDAGNNYEILTVVNDKPGNGDFEHVLSWFYESCKRDKKNLLIREVWNQRLAKHLINKRGFAYQGEDDLIKRF